MILYALKESNTGHFVTRNGGLDELNKDTQLFTSKSQPEKCLIRIKDEVEFPSLLVHEIVWKRLEEKYGKPRWEIDVDYKEFGDIQDSLEFQIVEISLNEEKTVKRLCKKRYRAKEKN